MFRALVLDKEPTFNATVQSLEENRLPDADVHVQVAYSTLNYKDGLAITNKSPVVRVWPMVAGIDGAGSVISSTHADWKAGDHFVHNGWGVGETHWGCLSEQARLKGDWLVKLPKAFTPRQAMAIGTAVHTHVLELDQWDSRYAIAPESIDRRTKMGKAEWEVFTTASTGRTVLTKADADLVMRMGRAVYAYQLLAPRCEPVEK